MNIDHLLEAAPGPDFVVVNAFDKILLKCPDTGEVLRTIDSAQGILQWYLKHQAPTHSTRDWIWRVMFPVIISGQVDSSDDHIVETYLPTQKCIDIISDIVEDGINDGEFPGVRKMKSGQLHLIFWRQLPEHWKQPNARIYSLMEEPIFDCNLGGLVKFLNSRPDLSNMSYQTACKIVRHLGVT